MDFSDIDLTSAEDKFLSKKNITTLLVIGILVLVIPFTVKLVERQQTLKSKAAGEGAITFVPSDSLQCDAAGNCTTTDSTVDLELRSPIGPPGTIVPTPTTGPTNPPTPTLPPGVPTNTPTPTSVPRPCSVGWTLSNPTPAPNTNIVVTVTGVSDPGGWVNVRLYRDGQACSNTTAGCSLTIAAGPVFTFSTVNSGAAGTHTLTFKTNTDTVSGTRTCGPDKTYTAQ